MEVQVLPCAPFELGSSSVGRADGSEPSGRRFDACLPSQFGGEHGSCEERAPRAPTRMVETPAPGQAHLLEAASAGGENGNTDSRRRNQGELTRWDRAPVANRSRPRGQGIVPSTLRQFSWSWFRWMRSAPFVYWLGSRSFKAWKAGRNRHGAPITASRSIRRGAVHRLAGIAQRQSRGLPNRRSRVRSPLPAPKHWFIRGWRNWRRGRL